MSEVKVRRATADDAEALTDLHHACWTEAYTGLLGEGRIAAVFADRAGNVVRRRDQLLDPARATWLAISDVGEPLEFAAAGGSRLDDAPASLELYALYTRAAAWGHGVGASLLRAAVGDEPAYLWVLEGNARAARFYAKHRFTFDGVRDDDVAGEVRLRMVRGAAPPTRLPPNR